MVRYFLPNNQLGYELSNKLGKLFESGKLFMVGPSKTYKEEYVVQTKFELKTSKTGGLEKYILKNVFRSRLQ